MDSVGDHALALQLAHVAQVHEDELGLAMLGPRFLEAERLDSGFRFLNELTKALFHLHRLPPSRFAWICVTALYTLELVKGRSRERLLQRAVKMAGTFTGSCPIWNGTE